MTTFLTAGRRRALSRWSGPFATWLLVAGVFILGSILTGDFRAQENLTNVLRQAAPLGVVAIGQTFVILTGGIDISVAPVIALGNTISMGIMNGQNGRIPQAIIAALAAGAAVGLVNGVVITKRNVPPFIVTLGTLSIVQGIVFLYTNQNTFGYAAPKVSRVGFANLGPIPQLVLPTAVLLVIFLIVQNRTVFGRRIYAVGGSERMARLSGVPTHRTVIWAYVICGTLAAATGVMLDARLGAGDPLAGTGFDWDSIAAVVIGGTALAGGRGGLGGTFAGVLILSMINNLMNLLNVSPFLQMIIKGLIILIAVLVSIAGLIQARARTLLKANLSGSRS
jgi:ribose/xylose/arabinose/galactoside ABC-type transport system permease subunit